MKLMPLVFAIAQPPTSRGVDRGAEQHEPPIAPDEGDGAPAELEHRDDEEGQRPSGVAPACAPMAAAWIAPAPSDAMAASAEQAPSRATGPDRARCGHRLPLGTPIRLVP